MLNNNIEKISMKSANQKFRNFGILNFNSDVFYFSSEKLISSNLHNFKLCNSFNSIVGVKS